MVEMKKAQSLDPLSTSGSNGIGRIHHFAQRYDLAVDPFRKTIEMDPMYAEADCSLGMTHMVMRRFDEAIPEYKKAIELSGNRPVIVSMLGLAYGMQGRTNETQKIFDEFKKLSHTSYVSPLSFWYPFYRTGKIGPGD
jgi:Flp pilus assembly protein TadD